MVYVHIKNKFWEILLRVFELQIHYKKWGVFQRTQSLGDIRKKSWKRISQKNVCQNCALIKCIKRNLYDTKKCSVGKILYTMLGVRIFSRREILYTSLDAYIWHRGFDFFKKKIPYIIYFILFFVTSNFEPIYIYMNIFTNVHISIKEQLLNYY